MVIKTELLLKVIGERPSQPSAEPFFAIEITCVIFYSWNFLVILSF